MSHAPQPGRRAALALAPGLALAACTAPQVEQTAGYSGGRLPRPERIYVVDPGVAADDVKLDDGVRQRLAQMTSDQSLSQQRLAAGRQAAGGVAAEVTAKLQSFGLPAERVGRAPPPGAGRVVIVEGHLLSVDQGNQTRRNLIGFGRGRSSVTVEVQVYYRDGQAAPRLISSFEATAQSPMTPGALGTMGAGAVVGRVAEVAASNAILSNVSNARSADTGSEGRRIGDALGLRLGRIFAEQGWIPESAVH
ncbi:DUF4410 domain-containing protein [Sediminicoccus rosea]|jgi:hypothetical protein|uniref:DUF4410 domain-containing protein n=1 Tax=Sediminicoccus rosea TaxID=1225128 RepID=A0ABZ0PHE0_9PROT|nr:DUF4410 domain-containing protein [Sediminicoccus rosea]WPB84881.1 DUF4410 domain-containing protein [Sediminicoccus rosea]